MFAAPARFGARERGSRAAARDKVIQTGRFRYYDGRMALSVTAHITGTVWEIRVNVGDDVEDEQVVVVLESMKMEMPVEAPSAGKVTSIAVEKGQAVEEGEVLLVLE